SRPRQRMAHLGELSRARGIRRNDSVYGDAGLRAGGPAECRDVPAFIRPVAVNTSRGEGRPEVLLAYRGTPAELRRLWNAEDSFHQSQHRRLWRKSSPVESRDHAGGTVNPQGPDGSPPGHL